MKLIHGSLSKYTLINGIQIAVAPRDSPPFPVDVMVFEEDTNLILTVDPVIEHEDEHIIRTMTDIMTVKKHKPGSVVVNGNSWYTIVIDLDSDPVCKAEWCERAIEQVLRLALKNKVTGIALPIIGTVHGALSLEEQLKCLLEKVETLSPQVLKQIWLIVPRKQVRIVKEIVTVFSGADRMTSS